MTDWKAARKLFDTNLGNNYPPADNVTQTPEMIAGISCYWYHPVQPHSRELIVYLHGGGYALGSHRSHGAMVSHIAAATGRSMLLIEYALAPEHPFPQGLQDVMAVMAALQSRFPDKRFGLMGDSAGGGLVMATAGEMKDKGMPPAIYHILISPWADMTVTNDSYERNRAIDKTINKEGTQEFAEAYAGDTPPEHPGLSPVNADVKGMAKVLIMGGTHEILEDDFYALYEHLKENEVNVELKMFEGAGHVWLIEDVEGESGKGALEEVRRFVGEKVR